MDRPDERPIDVVDRACEALLNQAVGVAQLALLSNTLLEAELEALAELTRGFAREGHGGDLIDGRRARFDERSHSRYQLGSLTRSGSRLDQEVRLQILRDARTRRGVGKR